MTCRGHAIRLFFEVLGVVTLLGLAGLFGGFLWFAAAIATEEPELKAPADAIVALTGGASRIEDGLALLARGHGKRLLISGVHRSTRAGELTRLSPQNPALFACCVDIDRRALNTEGNAIETAAWVRRHAFRSLVVVTSSYHMPRALTEFAAVMPGIELIPYPVVAPQRRGQWWWTSPATIRLYAMEYAKLFVARVRLRLEPTVPGSDVEAART